MAKVQGCYGAKPRFIANNLTKIGNLQKYYFLSKKILPNKNTCEWVNQ